jgi:hypothetical protein
MQLEYVSQLMWDLKKKTKHYYVFVLYVPCSSLMLNWVSGTYLVIKVISHIYIYIVVIKVASRYDKLRYYHLCVYNVICIREFIVVYFSWYMIWWGIVHTSWKLVCRMYVYHHPLHPFGCAMQVWNQAFFF